MFVVALLKFVEFNESRVLNLECSVPSAPVSYMNSAPKKIILPMVAVCVKFAVDQLPNPQDEDQKLAEEQKEGAMEKDSAEETVSSTFAPAGTPGEAVDDIAHDWTYASMDSTMFPESLTDPINRIQVVDYVKAFLVSYAEQRRADLEQVYKMLPQENRIKIDRVFNPKRK